MNFKVVEKFISINGEGQRSGELAVFIRLAHCNLSCSYCDTVWANQADVTYTEMTKEDIFEYILQTGIKNITLTGGEPLLHENTKELIELITNNKALHLEIETNGSVSLEDFLIEGCSNLSFTVDYKSPSSLMEKKMDLTNYELLRMKDTIKFVVGDLNDLIKAHDVIRTHQLERKCKVILSPIFGKIEMVDIVDYMKKHLLVDVKLQMQLHKIIWEPDVVGV
ncbi:MAG: putative 7-carboxy-7-deazaguanine synthase QueE [Clostridiales bacterium]|nr:putative 7-carboxy-7-deazaguanine synthase QueE [Clostridiales bacterium]